MEAFLVIAGIICLFLLTQRWFWVLSFGIGALASAFTTLACIFSFQILGALGAFFLMVICGVISSAIVEC